MCCFEVDVIVPVQPVQGPRPDVSTYSVLAYCLEPIMVYVITRTSHYMVYRDGILICVKKPATSVV